MSDKQLTVAELMARAAQEGRSLGESRPRRRRSLDEGGVSVAELTGSIPRVNKKPTEAKHSSIPLDDPAEDVPTTVSVSGAEIGEKTGPGHARRDDEADAAAERDAERGAGSAAGSDAEQDADAQEQAAQDDVDAGADEGVDKRVDHAAEDAASDASAEAEDAAEDDDDEDEMVLSVVTEDDPVRLTTGSFPALSPQLVDEAPEDDSLTENEGSDGEDEEIVTKFVFAGDGSADKADMQGDYADADFADGGYADGDDSDGEYRDQDFDDVAITPPPPVRERASDPAVAFATGTFAQVGTGQFEHVGTGQFEQVDADADDSADADAAEDRAVEDRAAVVAGVADDDAVEAEAMSDELDTYDELDGELEDEDGDYDEEYEDDYEDDEAGSKVSVLSVILMVIIAIAVGAGLFKGFEMLWMNLNKIITAVLAVAVTVGIVGVVHALRTERDGLSMVLAGAAGLAVTFGPLLIVGL